MAEPMNTELLAEAERLRSELREQDQLAEHWHSETLRLSRLLQEAQSEERRLTGELAEAQRSMKAQHALLEGYRTQLQEARTEIVSLQARLSDTETHG